MTHAVGQAALFDMIRAALLLFPEQASYMAVPIEKESGCRHSAELTYMSDPRHAIDAALLRTGLVRL
jgi:hypothetical protein